MLAPGPGRAVCPLAAACLLLTLFLCGPAVDSADRPPAPAEQPSYDRPDADHIRSTTDDILSDPRFRPRTSFGQWLVARLGRWWKLRPGAGSWLGRTVLWALVIWCVLALLAIFIHVIWTLWTMVRPGRRAGRLGARAPRFSSPESLSFEELRANARRAAEAGRFPEALSLLMRALLVRLGGLGILGLHQSKTNGDYVREYPPASAGRPPFLQFAGAFDGVVYGGADCDRAGYGRLESLCEQVLADVQEP